MSFHSGSANEKALNSFVTRYYRALEEDRSAVRAMYTDDAEVVWNSKPFPSVQALEEALRLMPAFKYHVTSTQIQEINPAVGQIPLSLVVVNGYVVGEAENSIFSQTFHLAFQQQSVNDSCKVLIKLDRFCIF